MQTGLGPADAIESNFTNTCKLHCNSTQFLHVFTIMCVYVCTIKCVCLTMVTMRV